MGPKCYLQIFVVYPAYKGYHSCFMLSYRCSLHFSSTASLSELYMILVQNGKLSSTEKLICKWNMHTTKTICIQ